MNIWLRILLRMFGPFARYAVNSKCYFDETIIDPFFIDQGRTLQRKVIQWRNAPNHALEPQNFAASVIYWAFCERIRLIPMEYPEKIEWADRDRSYKSTAEKRTLLYGEQLKVRKISAEQIGERAFIKQPFDVDKHQPEAGEHHG